MNTDKKITEQMLIDSLYEIVAENPDYVYDDRDAEGFCRYFNDEGEPSCVVGHVLARNGIVAEQVAPIKYSGAAAVIRETTGVLPSLSGSTLFYEMQAWQDAGTPWGEALEKAETLAKQGNWSNNA